MGEQLDLSKWSYRDLGPRGSAIVSKQAIELDGQGCLQIKAFLQDGELQVGMIGTQGKFEQKYGYFESRIKFQRQRGMHGSFWLTSPTYGKWAGNPADSGAEVDIIEFFGSKRKDRGVGLNVYWDPYKPKAQRTYAKDPPLDLVLGPTGEDPQARTELCDEFHDFGLLWAEEQYIFYIDGYEMFRTKEGLSRRSHYLILSLLCSDWERPQLDLEQLPDAMLVDYVRVYAPTMQPTSKGA